MRHILILNYSLHTLVRLTKQFEVPSDFAWAQSH